MSKKSCGREYVSWPRKCQHFNEDIMDKNEFKTMRLNCGLTQMELAAKLGISFGTLNRWERGHFEINHHAAQIFRQNAKAWTVRGKK